MKCFLYGEGMHFGRGFYGDVEEHPVTPEYIFRDYHNSSKPKCYNFEPQYDPGRYPYACCEMGEG